MNMIAVGDVALVRDAFDDAEALLETLGKLVGGGLDGRTIQAVVLAGHGLDALIQTRVAQGDGGVPAVEELVDGLAFLQACQGAMLPVDGGCVGERTNQPFMPEP